MARAATVARLLLLSRPGRSPRWSCRGLGHWEWNAFACRAPKILRPHRVWQHLQWGSCLRHKERTCGRIAAACQFKVDVLQVDQYIRMSEALLNCARTQTQSDGRVSVEGNHVHVAMGLAGIHVPSESDVLPYS
eukprot:2506696-Amphidinium_carterae.1